MADKPYFNDSGHPSTTDSTMIRMAADYNAGTQVYTPKVALSGAETITDQVANGASFSIPTFDSMEFTYVNGGAADDDLIETQVFKNGGSTVATLTYAYEGSTNNIASITQS